jgi:His/Glu/Gln/Arg/opine family amino acid ABC transporter permease subunit
MEFIASEGFIKSILFGLPVSEELGGLCLNLALSVLSFVLGLFLAMPLAVACTYHVRFISKLAIIYTNTIRSIPLILLIFWVYYVIPGMFGIDMSLFTSATISLLLHASVYQSEIIRSGLKVTHRGQKEAARSLGMSKSQISLYITIPQTFKHVLMPMFSFYISLFKDTSHIYIIGMIDLIQVGVIYSQREPDYIVEAYVIMAICFLAVTVTCSLLSYFLERNVKFADGNI